MGLAVSTRAGLQGPACAARSVLPLGAASAALKLRQLCHLCCLQEPQDRLPMSSRLRQGH